MIDELMNALERWQLAKADLKACEDDCEYDADYFCSSQAKTEQAARLEVETALTAFVDERVRSSSGAPNPDDAHTRRANPKDTVDTIQKGG